MSLRTTTSLATPASVPGVRRQVGQAVNCQIPPKLPRFGCTARSVGIFACHLNRAGLLDEADTLIRNFEIATGMAEDEDDSRG